MDSSRVLCVYYPFCYSVMLGASLFHALDVYPCGSTGFRRKGDDDASSLGAHRGNNSFFVPCCYVK